MDLSKVKSALDTVNRELNTVIDGEFKVRNLKVLSRLNLVSGALGLASTHIEAAEKRNAPKAKAATTIAAKK